MKTHHIIITVLLVVLTAPGCSREETASLPGGPLELVASVPYFDIETKAGEEFTDEVTAYPLAGTALAADPVLQSYAASGSYFFNIPGGADNIVFSTVEAAPVAYTAATDFVNGTISVSAAEGQPVGRDLIFGWLQNYSAGQTQATTDLRRASARLNISLKAIYGVDTVSNLTSTFQSAEVSVSGMHTSAVLEYQTLKYSYSGEGNVAFPLNQDENGVYAARIMTLPSTGTTTPVLTLTLTTPDGSVRSYSSPLPSGISTNYSYNMNLLLSWDNASADFTLSDIQMNTVEMDGIPSQSFDLLRFSENLLTFRNEGGYLKSVEIYRLRLWNISHSGMRQMTSKQPPRIPISMARKATIYPYTLYRPTTPEAISDSQYHSLSLTVRTSTPTISTLYSLTEVFRVSNTILIHTIIYK